MADVKTKNAIGLTARYEFVSIVSGKRVLLYQELADPTNSTFFYWKEERRKVQHFWCLETCTKMFHYFFKSLSHVWIHVVIRAYDFRRVMLCIMDCFWILWNHFPGLARIPSCPGTLSQWDNYSMLSRYSLIRLCNRAVSSWTAGPQSVHALFHLLQAKCQPPLLCNI